MISASPRCTLDLGRAVSFGSLCPIWRSDTGKSNHEASGAVFRSHVGLGLGTTVGPTPVLIAALGGFRTVAADLLWMKVEDLSEGGRVGTASSGVRVGGRSRPALHSRVDGVRLAHGLQPECGIGLDPRTGRAAFEAGLKVLQAGVEANPQDYTMNFEYAWTLQDRAHELYKAADKRTCRPSKLKGANAKAIRFHYRCYESLANMKRLFPALKEAQQEFPHDGTIRDWWRRISVVDRPRNNIQRASPADETKREYRATATSRWISISIKMTLTGRCARCVGLPTLKGHPVCEVCGGYSFKEKKLLAPGGGPGA